jgi:hypothetical protein
MRRYTCTLRGVLATALLASPMVGGAQDGRGRLGAWISGGGGVALTTGGYELVDAIGLHVQRDRLVVSGRRNSLKVNRQPSEAIGIGVGRVIDSRGARYTALSIGISRVSTTGYFDLQQGVTRSSAGLMAVADAALRSEAGVGVGLSAFGHTSSVVSFVGVAVELSLGKWR